jgi:hypothetical protein
MFLFLSYMFFSNKIGEQEAGTGSAQRQRQEWGKWPK